MGRYRSNSRTSRMIVGFSSNSVKRTDDTSIATETNFAGGRVGAIRILRARSSETQEGRSQP